MHKSIKENISTSVVFRILSCMFAIAFMAIATAPDVAPERELLINAVSITYILTTFINCIIDGLVIFRRES